MPNCCDIFKVEAVIFLLMLLMARRLQLLGTRGEFPFIAKLKHEKVPQICQCSMFGSDVAISKIKMYVNLICSDHHPHYCRSVASQNIHTLDEWWILI